MVLKVNDGSLAPFVYGGITLYASPFQRGSTRGQIFDSLGSPQQPRPCLTTPISLHRAAALHEAGLGSSPFARHY